MTEKDQNNQVKLNLGCGEDIREGFINIDIQPFEGISLRANAINLSKIKPNSVDFIVAQHLLEYIPRPLMSTTIEGWNRILKDAGVLEVRVPDIREIAKNITDRNIGAEMGIALLYGKQGSEFDVIFNGFSEDYLEGILVGKGFTILNVVKEDGDIIVTAEKKGVVEVDLND